MPADVARPAPPRRRALDVVRVAVTAYPAMRWLAADPSFVRLPSVERTSRTCQCGPVREVRG
ncbi:MAG TPA: hypothetical protein VIJ94_00800 [Caulobacteraceae bacterium]